MNEKIIQHGLPGKFDYLEHTADIYIVSYGSNVLELFENAGIALFESMTRTEKLEASEERNIFAKGYDLENLLYQWLEELLILYYSENLMCREIRVEELKIRRNENGIEYSVSGYCRGEYFNPEKHEAKVEIKAVTYHLMKIIREKNMWKAYFVLDI